MAVIWQRTKGASHYQVRTAGGTRRLYTNGVFHSQFNPHSPVQGSVWDLLLLPAFLHPLGDCKRILLLGVGGGAVIRQLQHFMEIETLIGIDIDPIHLQLARRFFGVSGEGIELVCADAIEWIKGYKGPPFDLIIDDLFGHADGVPCRAVAANTEWMQQLIVHLHSQGTLVMNFDTPKVLKTAAVFSARHIALQFKVAWLLQTPLYDNAVGIFTRQLTSRQQWLARLQAFPALDLRRKTCKLKVKISPLAL